MDTKSVDRTFYSKNISLGIGCIMMIIDIIFELLYEN